MSLNKVMLIGNVGQEPTVRYLEQSQGSAKVATFTLATTERYRDRNGESRENTEWHNIVAWRQNADVVERFVHKGTQLFIEGRLRTRQWLDQTGVKRFTTEIITDNLQLLGRRPDGAAEGVRPAAPQSGYQPVQPAASAAPAPAPAAPAAKPEEPVDFSGAGGGEDDLPF